MEDFEIFKKKNETWHPVDQTSNQKALYTQLVISFALGLGAFLTFCVLRTKWTGLYAARKKQHEAASSLPELPNTFFGWIPTLIKISDEEVLASAGLDAFVFLSFFRMAKKYLAVTLFFALVVILPVNVHYENDWGWTDTNSTEPSIPWVEPWTVSQGLTTLKKSKRKDHPPTTHLWMYVAFTYLFSIFAFYLLIVETKRIIRIRQDYLGSQSTITDRTIRLSGIPPEFRSEDKIKDFIEKLEIGKVESVTLCRNWKELDDLIAQRDQVLRKLEEAWTVFLGKRRVERNLESLPVAQPLPPDPLPLQSGEDEESRLLNDVEATEAHSAPYARKRPATRIWYGRFNLQSKKIDAIDYYTEKLRQLDEKITTARQKEYPPMPLAFVSMDSVAACQMAIQAILDPLPMRFLANPAPAPSDVVWRNTYISRTSRMIRAWSITVFIAFLTVFWSALLVPIAGLLNLESIHKVWPQLAETLEKHQIGGALVQTGLPTLILSLLNIAVPYLYNWLSNMQGMTSQGDVELSVISKNFFFTFFNLFVVFTVFGTAYNFYGFVDSFRDALRDTTRVAYTLAASLQGLASFYVNLIILQGLGLFPFRLLEFGAVALYPLGLIGAKTPRDYAELEQPPVFSYGFFLPQTMLIFIICTVYSVLPSSWLVLSFGLIYFSIGAITYKYQLLYAMDHRQHSTGRAWTIICNRVILGLIVFQLAMAGVLALKTAFKRSALILPLIIGTIWFSYFFSRSFEPLTLFIALRSIHRPDHPDTYVSENSFTQALGHRVDPSAENGAPRGRTVDEQRETGLRFMNPNLTSEYVCQVHLGCLRTSLLIFIFRLGGVWITKRHNTRSGSNSP
ncbi:DUF221-domain-containing protein [Xylona heveae TC161]|uniref:DUF221-domain-containing protein n=1 Tax=Xylona heveae (strain CBS 132557 / TC161) TaxID=1328760 RepID=A0A165JZU9_XYLHT|nr:DUF221-domain-containing protein [Xylona heveae TC161]KZF26830.1 DUF221-domain-containing protein [Xylona heveae TC161]